MRKRLVWLSFIVLELNLIPQSSFGAFHTFVVGQYPNYGPAGLPIAEIQYDKLTHIVYFSLSPFADGTLDTSNVVESDLSKMVAHADANGVKTMISVGGWDRSVMFPIMAAIPADRARFAEQLRQYCLDHGLHGADLDWEPVSRDEDRENYSLLIREVHDEFQPFGLVLTISVFAFGREILPEAIDYVAWVHIMAYDDTPPHHSSFELAVASCDYWESYGVPRRKQMLAVPFYGKDAGNIGYPYRHIVEEYHPGPEIDYVGGIGFNGIRTIQQKTSYVLKNRLRGVMAWELSQDTADDSSLLAAINNAIVGASSSDIDGSGHIDFLDLAILASAWQSEPNDDNWIPICDLSKPKDDVVNLRDLAVFSKNWLMDL